MHTSDTETVEILASHVDGIIKGNTTQDIIAQSVQLLSFASMNSTSISSVHLAITTYQEMPSNTESG